MAAVRMARDGKLPAEALRPVQDECIRELVAMEESAGLSSVTDGEFRRRGWSAGFIDAVEGFGLRDGTLLGFRDDKGGKGRRGVALRQGEAAANARHRRRRVPLP